MESYWDLYVEYVHHCVESNKENDIDPHHYQMEWNHFLPKSIFGDWPIGQWLTLRQHAIASALQTLALKRNCMFGWHKRYLPEPLLTLSWAYYGKISQEEGKKRGRRINSEKDELGRSVNAVKGSRVLHKIIHAERDERGKSLHGIKAGELLHSEKDEQGRSMVAMRVNKQVWESTVDGFRSHSGGVALHNKSNGWDPKARVRIS